MTKSTQAKLAKPRWKTVRCIIEYRTPRPNFSERDLARQLNSLISTLTETNNFPSALSDSRIWAKQFTSALARMDAARPRRLRAGVKALEVGVARLHKL